MNQTKNNLLPSLLSILQTVLVFVFVVIAVLSFSARVPFLSKMGMTFYALTSGSMEPAIPTGSLIYSGAYAMQELKTGDVLTFKVVGEDPNKPVIVTHRIAEVKTTDLSPDEKDPTKKKTEYQFVTKGDANKDADKVALMGGNILGKYKWHVPYLGYVTSFAQTQQGFLLLVILPAAILIVWEVVSLVLHFKKEAAAKSESEIAQLKAELELHKKNNV